MCHSGGQELRILWSNLEDLLIITYWNNGPNYKEKIEICFRFFKADGKISALQLPIDNMSNFGSLFTKPLQKKHVFFKKKKLSQSKTANVKHGTKTSLKSSQPRGAQICSGTFHRQ